ncbi:hypothetical protein CVS42_10990 [Aeromonas veronii]|uniref:hypothetical protein n=1 Tax=Aeromonas veronii TaxID=654 RepID=UPI000C2837AB|nr:hypothetical protein [Aeromonas veronii]ATY81304.1 hypothetical protein CVS42_10990 [Aeromonas veronii]
MYLQGKARYTLSLMSLAIKTLNKIKDDRDSPTSLIASISPDLAFVVISDIENLFHRIAKLFELKHFSSSCVGENEAFYNVWGEYIDLVCRVMKVIIYSPDYLNRFFSGEKSFIDFCISLFDSLYVQMQHNGIPINFNDEKYRHTFNSIISDLLLVEEHLEDLLDVSRKSSYFTAFEKFNGTTASKLNNAIENKINDVDLTIKRMSEAFENEKNSIGFVLSQFEDNSSEMLNDYFKRLESIEKTEVDIGNKFNDAVKKAEGILKLASQEGMASAFQKRHDDLKWPEIRWISLFTFSLVSLAVFGAWFVETVFSENGIGTAEIISRISISIPLVWLAWFSGKQFNHVTRLREDYAYKVAVAMAYHGYKDEAGQVDSEMSGKLLENIILHFADNPVRLYKNDNSASIVEAFIKNNKASDIFNAIKGAK